MIWQGYDNGNRRRYDFDFFRRDKKDKKYGKIGILLRYDYFIASEGQVMNKEYTAVVKQERDWWIGWIEEVPGVNCQERTRDELLQTLRITLKEALDFNRQDALAAVGSGYVEEKIAI
jgi:predicted RNase H-like HicB family nuclease